jgi:hypothetical protein
LSSQPCVTQPQPAPAHEARRKASKRFGPKEARGDRRENRSILFQPLVTEHRRDPPPQGAMPSVRHYSNGSHVAVRLRWTTQTSVSRCQKRLTGRCRHFTIANAGFSDHPSLHYGKSINQV